MRRALSILLLSLFAWMQAAPAFALDSQSGLPACCRRDGHHHCATGMADTSVSRTFATIAPKCPASPQATAATSPISFTPATAQNISTPVFVHPASAPQTEAHYRVSFARSRQKRGPPALTL
jgi:hypothetical protein